MRVELGVESTPSSSTMKYGLSLGERRGVGASVWMAGTYMGVLFLCNTLV
jgi:hypothetical protein